MSGNLSHEGAGASPQLPFPKPPHAKPEPYAALLVNLEELEDYSHKALIQYPKYERFLLCSCIRDSINIIQRLTVVAWKRHHKKTTLQELDVELEVLRKWVTKSVRLKYITPSRAGIWLAHINEIGRQIGGWLKVVAQ